MSFNIYIVSSNELTGVNSPRGVDAPDAAGDSDIPRCRHGRAYSALCRIC